jgi:hypothetical protein
MARWSSREGGYPPLRVILSEAKDLHLASMFSAPSE